MEVREIDAVLTKAETAVAERKALGPTGFWKAVAAVKGSPVLVSTYATRIGAIDAAAFRVWPLVRVPMSPGTWLMSAATIGGLALIWWAYYLDSLTADLVFLVGFGVILSTTHALAHVVVGRVLGMKFIGWFIGSVRRPQPGVKLDYAAYLMTPAPRRAWMHASGAITTKAMPFLMLGAAFGAGLDTWVIVLLVGLGVGMLITDWLWSTKSSDWMKFKREMAYAGSGSGAD